MSASEARKHNKRYAAIPNQSLKPFGKRRDLNDQVPCPRAPVDMPFLSPARIARQAWENGTQHVEAKKMREAERRAKRYLTELELCIDATEWRSFLQDRHIEVLQILEMYPELVYSVYARGLIERGLRWAAIYYIQYATSIYVADLDIHDGPGSVELLRALSVFEMKCSINQILVTDSTGQAELLFHSSFSSYSASTEFLPPLDATDPGEALDSDFRASVNYGVLQSNPELRFDGDLPIKEWLILYALDPRISLCCLLILPWAARYCTPSSKRRASTVSSCLTSSSPNSEWPFLISERSINEMKIMIEALQEDPRLLGDGDKVNEQLYGTSDFSADDAESNSPQTDIPLFGWDTVDGFAREYNFLVHWWTDSVDTINNYHARTGIVNDIDLEIENNEEDEEEEEDRDEDEESLSVNLEHSSVNNAAENTRRGSDIIDPRSRKMRIDSSGQVIHKDEQDEDEHSVKCVPSKVKPCIPKVNRKSSESTSSPGSIENDTCLNDGESMFVPLHHSVEEDLPREPFNFGNSSALNPCDNSDQDIDIATGTSKSPLVSEHVYRVKVEHGDLKGGEDDGQISSNTSTALDVLASTNALYPPIEDPLLALSTKRKRRGSDVPSGDAGSRFAHSRSTGSSPISDAHEKHLRV